MHITLFFQEIIKGHQVVLIKFILIPLLCFVLFCCDKNDKTKVVADLEVAKEDLKLNPKEGKWYYQNKPFNGYSVVYYANDTLAEKVGYYDGKKEGKAFKWFADGTLKKEYFYVANHLDGTVKTWWPSGAPSTESHYVNGTKHGEQKVWYANGQLSRKTQINNGKEEGLQQAWLENGKLYVNYEAKNGRIFGMKRSNLCYELEDEIVQLND
mgnify:FL=1|tara:strand:+ start:331 stop:963 length:633 start_codon:yes stop_codon:yes gene_type:complete